MSAYDVTTIRFGDFLRGQELSVARGNSRSSLSLTLPSIHAELRDFHWDKPFEFSYELKDCFLLVLTLHPRKIGASGCFPGLWSAHGARDLGKMLIVPPGQPFHSVNPAGRQKILLCYLPNSQVDVPAELLEASTPTFLDWSIDAKSDAVEWLLKQIALELARPGSKREVLINAYATALSVEAARVVEAAAECHTQAGGLAGWRLRRIRERLNRNPFPKVAELAALCGLSERHLARAFKEQTGQTLKVFIDQERSDRAQRMLLRDDRKIAEVAKLLGFASAASFSVAFRRATGMSPKQFKAYELAEGTASISENTERSEMMLSAVEFRTLHQTPSPLGSESMNRYRNQEIVSSLATAGQGGWK